MSRRCLGSRAPDRDQCTVGRAAPQGYLFTLRANGVNARGGLVMKRCVCGATRHRRTSLIRSELVKHARCAPTVGGSVENNCVHRLLSWAQSGFLEKKNYLKGTVFHISYSCSVVRLFLSYFLKFSQSKDAFVSVHRIRIYRRRHDAVTAASVLIIIPLTYRYRAYHPSLCPR